MYSFLNLVYSYVILFFSLDRDLVKSINQSINKITAMCTLWYSRCVKGDTLYSLKKICILSENVTFHE